MLVEAPRPQQVSTNATTFARLASLGRDGFFDRGARTRTCVLVTDGQTRSYATGDVARSLAGPRGCRLLAVRVGDGRDRVFDADGTAEAGFAPDPAAAANVRQLAEATGGEPSTRPTSAPPPRLCGGRRASGRSPGRPPRRRARHSRPGSRGSRRR